VWTTSSTTPSPDDQVPKARVTHRFHPLFGREFEFVEHRFNWGEDRVSLRDEHGVVFSLPAGWTDVVAVDPFVVIAEGRCPFTTTGLLELAELIDRIRTHPSLDRTVNPISPRASG
ncbi:DUF5372 family protein, partial [Nocardia amamiensis]|uniref:DUF5372 family protein n=1 Tax=Nocardia amamiensis TaxID=404578 RepID=UPI000B31031F